MHISYHTIPGTINNTVKMITFQLKCKHNYASCPRGPKGSQQHLLEPFKRLNNDKPTKWLNAVNATTSTLTGIYNRVLHQCWGNLWHHFITGISTYPDRPTVKIWRSRSGVLINQNASSHASSHASSKPCVKPCHAVQSHHHPLRQWSPTPPIMQA